MNGVKFKVGDKVVFCKSSLDSGMIDAKEGDVFTVQAQDNSIIYLKGRFDGYHHTHFEHYVEKEKEMEKKFAKVGDKIRIVAAESTGDCYKNGDVLEVVAAHPSWVGVDVFIDDLGNFHVYHTEYEIVEDGKEDDFVFTEEHVGMEVWDVIYGKGVVKSVDNVNFPKYPVHVLFDRRSMFEDCSKSYTMGGSWVGSSVRSLFFSEPKIEAERFPPKKKFAPTLKKGDVVIVEWVGELTKLVVEQETEKQVRGTDGEVWNKDPNVSFFKLGEEIKF